MIDKHLIILGTRGVPAQHGGFETFAEQLALYLVKKSNWTVTVYCQVDEQGTITEDIWNGVKRVHIPVRKDGAAGTVVFDWKSVIHASKSRQLILTLGYNTAIFNLLFRLKGIKNVINMDGIEWKRKKWSTFERVWLYVNERLGCLIGNHLIADHPEIKKHLQTRVSEKKITMIPYGSNMIDKANASSIELFGLEKNKYCIVIARPEPENLILEIVKAFSRKFRGYKLVILGNYDIQSSKYQSEVINAAGNEVVFLGAIYDKQIVEALRFYASLYIHGHTVGGTNPSLVEALGAGTPVLAHNNKFNRWVVGEAGTFFDDENDIDNALDKFLSDREYLFTMMDLSKSRYKEAFTWSEIMTQYENLLVKNLK